MKLRENQGKDRPSSPPALAALRSPPCTDRTEHCTCVGLMGSYDHSVYITNPAALDAATFEEIALPIIVDTLGDNHVDPGGESLSWQDRGVSTSRASIISRGCVL